MIVALKDCIGCQAAGLPEPGYSFYCCDKCLDKLANVLELAEAGALVDPPMSGWVS